jgi:hypothetical protein
MDEFEKASTTERGQLDMLAYYLGCCFVPTPTRKMCCIDGFFYKNGKTYAVEAKVRTCRYDRYDSILLEKQKYRNMMNTIIDNDLADEMLYVQFFKDGIVVIFNLNTGDWKWQYEMHNKTSVVDNGKVMKEVGYLPYSQCKIIDLKNNVVIQ